MGFFKVAFIVCCAGIALVSYRGAHRSAGARVVQGAQVSTGANIVTGSIEMRSPQADPASGSSVPWATAVAARPRADLKPAEADDDELAVPSRKTTQQEIGRSLQRELKRVGCYDDVISGEWTEAAKRAMRAFNAKVNATLPTDAPDHILLTLVSGHRGRACERPCSASAKAGDCTAQKTAARGPAPARAVEIPVKVASAGPLDAETYASARASVFSSIVTPLPAPPSVAPALRNGAVASVAKLKPPSTPNAKMANSSTTPKAKAAGAAPQKTGAGVKRLAEPERRLAKAPAAQTRAQRTAAVSNSFDASKYFRDLSNRGS